MKRWEEDNLGRLCMEMLLKLSCNFYNNAIKIIIVLFSV